MLMVAKAHISLTIALPSIQAAVCSMMMDKSYTKTGSHDTSWADGLRTFVTHPHVTKVKRVSCVIGQMPSRCELQWWVCHVHLFAHFPVS